MAANRGAVDHLLPVIRQTQFNEGLKHSIPHALFGPPAKAHIDRIPLSVAVIVVVRKAKKFTEGCGACAPKKHDLQSMAL